jgi:hypothetical protein
MDPRLAARADANRPSPWRAVGNAVAATSAMKPRYEASGGSAGADAAALPPGAFRDWEGLSNTHHLNQIAAASPRRTGSAPAGARGGVLQRMTEREGSPSVAVFAEAAKRAHAALNDPHAVARALGGQPLASRGGERGGRSLALGSDQQALVDHQTYLAWKRAEYARRLQCEAEGAAFVPQPLPFSKEFAAVAAAGARNNYDADAAIRAFGTAIDVDFTRRSAQMLAPQVVGTPEEIAWLQRPLIPPPRGWQGTWDTCPGHEVLLQLLAVSGATPANSPGLTRHIMYPDLLSCVQRMLYGCYNVLYDRPGEPPHERYFYIKSLPLASRAQYCPFLCYSTHRQSHTAIDAIPLCNVIWVTPGVHTDKLQRYLVAPESRYVYGPYVGKRRAEMLIYGAFSVWVYDGTSMRSVDIVSTDPLAYEMWLTVLDNVAQVNASLDLSGRVRTVQRYIEELKVAGNLKALKPDPQPGFFERFFGRRGAGSSY